MPYASMSMREIERESDMNSRHLKPVVVAAIAAASSLLTVLAHADGIYVGGALGAPHFGDTVNGVEGGSSGVSGKVFGGYQLNPNFALEAGVAQLGRISNGSGSIKSHGEYLDAVGLLPLGGNFSLLGSAGLAHVNLNTSNGDSDGFGLKLGLGGEYALSQRVSLRGEYERYQPSAFGSHPVVGQFTFGVRVGF
jgi:OOP family OmpA-OmpF porin